VAGGLAVTKEPGTDRHAEAFNAAGYTVLAFDYRCFGESEGRPRQVARIRDQLDDWRAAIAYARALPEVEPGRLALWGHSSSGGHVVSAAARDRGIAAAIALAPLVDGPAIAPNAMRHQAPLASLRFTARALRDALGDIIGHEPLLVPLAGERGTVTSLTSPDALTGAQALNPSDRYPGWQEVAARSALRMGFYRPGRHARRVACPLLVIGYQDDGVAPPGPAVKVARRAPRPTREPARRPLRRLHGRSQAAVEAQLAFLTPCSSGAPRRRKSQLPRPRVPAIGHPRGADRRASAAARLASHPRRSCPGDESHRCRVRGGDRSPSAARSRADCHRRPCCLVI
jgi:alpha-beta hydrolase superfamily lysophospholipase